MSRGRRVEFLGTLHVGMNVAFQWAMGTLNGGGLQVFVIVVVVVVVAEDDLSPTKRHKLDIHNRMLLVRRTITQELVVDGLQLVQDKVSTRPTVRFPMDLYHDGIPPCGCHGTQTAGRHDCDATVTPHWYRHHYE